MLETAASDYWTQQGYSQDGKWQYIKTIKSTDFGIKNDLNIRSEFTIYYYNWVNLDKLLKLSGTQFPGLLNWV